MKSFLILIATLALTCRAQDPPECRCGAFITLPNEELEVMPFPPIDLASCEESQECAVACTQEWMRITNDGDLDTVMNDGNTVGQHMCDNLKLQDIENIGPHDVYLYYNICRGPWLYDGHTSQQPLCCKDGQYVTCGPGP